MKMFTEVTSTPFSTVFGLSLPGFPHSSVTDAAPFRAARVAVVRQAPNPAVTAMQQWALRMDRGEMPSASGHGGAADMSRAATLFVNPLVYSLLPFWDVRPAAKAE